MRKLYLICTRSAISASALVYIINQSPDFYNVSHSNLWLNEVSDQFGTAHTINDWWNIPANFTAYDVGVRNAEQLNLHDLKSLVENFSQTGINKNLALFTHAKNPKQIQQLAEQNNLPIRVVSTIMGDQSHLFVPSWIKREYNSIMNPWQDFEHAWRHLSNQRTIQDTKWSDSGVVLSMADWLLDASNTYQILGIANNHDANIWLSEYRNKNSITTYVDIEEYWSEEHRGTLTKMCVFMYLLNQFLTDVPDINVAQLYAQCLHEYHTANVMEHYGSLDSKVRKRLGIS